MQRIGLGLAVFVLGCTIENPALKDDEGTQSDGTNDDSSGGFASATSTSSTGDESGDDEASSDATESASGDDDAGTSVTATDAESTDTGATEGTGDDDSDSSDSGDTDTQTGTGTAGSDETSGATTGEATDETTGETTDTSTDTTEGTDTTATTGGPECFVHADCAADPLAPYCIAGSCVGCDAFSAAGTTCQDETTAATPVCSLATQRCVPCTADDLGVCDVDQACIDESSCGACKQHDDCMSGGCHIETGECIVTNRFFIDASASVCPGLGTLGQPFCEFAPALALVPSGGRAVLTATPGVYDEDLQIAGRTVVVRKQRDSEGIVEIVDNGLSAPVGVDDDARLYLFDVLLSSAGGYGGHALSGVLTLDQVTVDLEAGVMVEGGSVVIRRSRISGPLRIEAGATMILENSFWSNGDAEFSGALDIRYSTVVLPFVCVNSPIFEVRNSIVQSPTGRLSNTECSGTFTESSMSPQGGFDPPPPLHAVDYPEFDAANFVNLALGDLHLSPKGHEVFRGTCLVNPDVDPTIDYDGDPRPAPGELCYRGADTP